MKRRVRQNLIREEFDPKSLYKEKGLSQWIAKHPVFEAVTLGVVAVNALWIGIDADFNSPEAPGKIFLVADNVFCAIFTLEWLVRFLAFRRKRDGLKDGWFVFDAALVSEMVLETWVLSGLDLSHGGLGAKHMRFVRLARLLRLTRVARMVRLFRAVPELLILVKGMVAALRSVFTTFILLISLIYIFALLFRQLTMGSPVLQELYFGSMPSTMYTLLISGIFFDNFGAVAHNLSQHSGVATVLFWTFVLISSLTVMNMLIAVICEAVSSVAAAEKEAMQVMFVKKKLQGLFGELDESGDGRISRREFMLLLEKPEAAQLLTEAGLDVVGLVDQADIIFQSEEIGSNAPERELDFTQFLEMVLSLRSSCTATVKDVIDLRRYVRLVGERLGTRLDRIEQGMQQQPPPPPPPPPRDQP